jgi:hypothetical protein
MTRTRSLATHRLLLLALCSLAPLGAHADALATDPTVDADVSADAAHPGAALAVAEPTSAASDVSRGCFFAPLRSYPLRDGGALWHNVPDGLTLLFDAGDDSNYNYAMQYDYTSDSVVNVVRYSDDDHSVILRGVETTQRPAADHTGHGSRLRIKTPHPQPPPVGCYWLEFVASVRSLAVRRE